jgi:hypothetical protein
VSRTVAIVVVAVAVLGMTALTGLAQRDEPPDLGSPVVVPPADDTDDGSGLETTGDSREVPARRGDDATELATAQDDDGDASRDRPDRSRDDRAPWVTDVRVDEAPAPGGDSPPAAGNIDTDDDSHDGPDDDSGGDD